MPELEKKQKIIIGIILLIMIAVIIFYFYNNIQKTNEEIILGEETEETEETEESEQTEEKTEIKESENEETEEIIIHIAGAVQKEGILKLKEGARIADAIEQAGGLKENASTKNVNLAYMLEDGQKVYIPTKEEEQIITTIITDGDGQEIQNGESTNAKTSKKTNINTATQTQLEQITGIGEATAKKIIEYRNENGKFKTIEDIKNVSGIGEAKFSQMKEYIEV